MKSEYYKNYRGPELVLATLWVHGNEKQDITNYVQEYYGTDLNWNGNLITYDEIFPDKKEYQYYVEFISDDGRIHYFRGVVGEPNQIFNMPLATPMNQLI
tara:strand:- start:90 stop:389 length:300 start_codon:yes stop_codon:yes gene_type:complete